MKYTELQSLSIDKVDNGYTLRVEISAENNGYACRNEFISRIYRTMPEIRQAIKTLLK